MNWLQQLQTAINYMEAHLLETINYEDVAREVHMSPYNFHRTFRLLAGVMANEYLRNRRLSLAAQELLMTQQKVIEVALKYGYESPESFTKAFCRFHGFSPKQLGSSGSQFVLYNPLVIKISLKGGQMMPYRIEERAALTFLTFVRAFDTQRVNEADNQEIPHFWTELKADGRLTQLLELPQVGKKDLYGLCAPSAADSQAFDYGVGILLDGKLRDELVGGIGDACCLWSVAPASYVVLACEGVDGSSIERAWEQFYQEFLPQTGFQQAEAADFEVYYEAAPAGLFCELWIPVEKA